MRRQPGTGIPDFTEKHDPNIITQIRKYELITPLFGGGVEPMVADPITIIRGTSIRGHLRFWWRATRGGKDLDELRRLEGLIWGQAASKKGKEKKQDQEDTKEIPTVQLKVQEVISSKRRIKFDDQEKGEFILPTYASFPIRPTRKDTGPAKYVKPDITFTLKISFHRKYQKDVEAALWAWETFGGIGARTRRGFGAIHLLAINDRDFTYPTKDKVLDWIGSNLRQYTRDSGYPDNVPHLSPSLNYLFLHGKGNSIVTWKSLINTLQKFRTSPFGKKSLWPEGRVISAIANHNERTIKDKGKFPRAAFGLPIVFRLENTNYILQGADDGKERLASPLILRPIKLQDSQEIGIIAILDGVTLPQTGLQLLKWSNPIKKISLSEIQPTKEEAEKHPLLSGHREILKAFLNFAKGEYYK